MDFSDYFLKILLVLQNEKVQGSNSPQLMLKLKQMKSELSRFNLTSLVTLSSQKNGKGNKIPPKSAQNSGEEF